MYRRGKRGVIYINVQGVRQSSGTTDRERAKALEHRLNNEAWDLAHGLRIPNWNEAVVKWGTDNPKLAARKVNKHYAIWWHPFLDGKKLPAITPALIHQTVKAHRPGVSLDTRTKPNATANAYVAYVARVIRHSSNLRADFQYYPVMLPADRWTPPEEWLRIAQHLTPDELDVLTFSLATGLREANVMFFEWPWDHQTWGAVPADDTKTDVPYGVPFNRTAQTVLERRRAASVKHVRYVFTDAGKPWYTLKLLRALARACKAAELPVMTVHALRHTFGTWLARNGVPKDVRRRLMGHGTGDVHDRYIHHDVESLRPFSEVIDEILAAARRQVGGSDAKSLTA